MTAKPPKRAYRREKNKVQRTVRIDKDLEKAALVKADSEGLLNNKGKPQLTAVIERGLMLYLQEKRDSELVLRGRFLWNVIPLWLQKLTLRFWVFIVKTHPDPLLERSRKFVSQLLLDIPEEQFQEDLPRLRELISNVTNPPQEKIEVKL